jgi:hypothetical protein
MGSGEDEREMVRRKAELWGWCKRGVGLRIASEDEVDRRSTTLPGPGRLLWTEGFIENGKVSSINEFDELVASTVGNRTPRGMTSVVVAEDEDRKLKHHRRGYCFSDNVKRFGISMTTVHHTNHSVRTGTWESDSDEEAVGIA